jgi:hypothetical protein
VIVEKKKNILVQKAFIYKIKDKRISPHGRMKINQKLLVFIKENEIEILGMYEDDVKVAPQNRKGLKDLITAYNSYLDKNFQKYGIDNMMSLIGVKILVATDINQLGANTLDSMEVLETLTKNSQVLFI